MTVIIFEHSHFSCYFRTQLTATMTDTDTILDAPGLPEEKPFYKWLRRIFIVLEIALWGIGILALLFKIESWEGSNELFILASTLLALFYLLFTFLITAARGKLQILGALGAGATIALLFIGPVFVVESWAGGWELLWIARLLGGIALIATLYFLTKARQSGNATGFYWKILVRLLVIFLLAL